MNIHLGSLPEQRITWWRGVCILAESALLLAWLFTMYAGAAYLQQIVEGVR